MPQLFPEDAPLPAPGEPSPVTVSYECVNCDSGQLTLHLLLPHIDIYHCDDCDVFVKTDIGGPDSAT